MKTEQLQIRVSREQKAWLTAAAKAAGVSVSAWVLEQALPGDSGWFAALSRKLAQDPKQGSYALAALNDALTRSSPRALKREVAVEPAWLTDPFHRAYVAAMVEQACHDKRVATPEWTKQVPALEVPFFSSSLLSLRMHLLRSSPPPFRARNIFIDSTLGARV